MLSRFTLFVLLLVSGPGFAGVVFEFEVVDLTAPGEAPDIVNTVVEGENIRMDVKGPRGANADMIFRGAEQAMLAVDHDNGIYVRVDSTTIESISRKLAALDAELREAMQNAPPEQRALLEEALGERGGATAPVVDIRATGEREDIQGYPSARFRLVRDGIHLKDFWVTSWENVEGGREAAAAFVSLADFIQALQDAMPDFAKSPAVGSNAYEHLDELDGFPVLTIDYAADGTATGENRFTGSRTEAVDAAAFEAPAGYTAQDIVPRIGVQ